MAGGYSVSLREKMRIPMGIVSRLVIWPFASADRLRACRRNGPVPRSCGSRFGPDAGFVIDAVQVAGIGSHLVHSATPGVSQGLVGGQLVRALDPGRDPGSPRVGLDPRDIVAGIAIFEPPAAEPPEGNDGAGVRPLASE